MTVVLTFDDRDILDGRQGGAYVIELLAEPWGATERALTGAVAWLCP